MLNRKRVSRNDAEQLEVRLKELTTKGEILFNERTNFGPLPEIKLARKSRLDRIIKLAKR
jgi:hypothetical protein